MPYKKVLQAENVIIGTKQTVRALKSGHVLEVLLASDAEPRIIHPIIQVAEEVNVPITMVDSMRELGKACGIDVGATAAAILI
ncbi:ribosome-associated protein L7Ae-like [Bacillus sp. J14TS2]|uniref:50S ribosomal protein L7ae-like protein n=1 Tax=unclassified Bacillus (in: firmicutes) TaxID=185979 RepID=UPI001A97B772|nr:MULTISPECIES: 50S ribosomal protein L7ae-like protein [unclassified Bacillus (in: firmicutes)]MBO0995824.1 50S ribosomal protein L7ae-like protein [Bacillus sp. SD088]GIN72213.1 ribosome-associated protein L7Ae-like [Bacillus sp. J14TS2]